MSTEPALMSLVSVAKAIASKEVSSREVTKSCLDRIAQWQPRLNAFMAIEAETALAAADAADADLAKGKNRGVLHGVPQDSEVSARIANSIGPAFDGFAAVAGTLPFDLEPASFLLVQNVKVAK